MYLRKPGNHGTVLFYSVPAYPGFNDDIYNIRVHTYTGTWQNRLTRRVQLDNSLTDLKYPIRTTLKYIAKVYANLELRPNSFDCI